MIKKLEKLENDLFSTDDEDEVPPSDIVAYNELRSCADLFRMYKQGILIVQPEFQREIVWRTPAQTRFIDSLIKQLPIPSMCFSLDYKTQKWQVIDGLQRMSSIIKFLDEEAWTLSNLEDINIKISGKRTSEFKDELSDLNEFYIRVENLTLPITVIRCDYSKKSHTNYLFTIFHRLNTGGMKLNNQEIRNCIYAGSFNLMLKELNQYPGWKKLNRMKSDTGYRFTKQELILRLFALNQEYKKYGGRLAGFLNDYMDRNKNANEAYIAKQTRLFKRTVDIVLSRIFDDKSPPKMPISVLESLLVGVSLNIDVVESWSSARLKKSLAIMRNHEEFSEARLVEGLSGKQRVINRINVAREAFSS